MRFYNHTNMAFPIVRRRKNGMEEWQNQNPVRGPVYSFNTVHTTSVGLRVGSYDWSDSTYTNCDGIHISYGEDHELHGNPHSPSKMATAVCEALDPL